MRRGFYFALILVALVAIAVIFFRINSLTGNLVLDSSGFQINDNLKGNLALTIEKGDSLSNSTRILVSVIKDGFVLNASTLTLNEFVKLSGSSDLPIEKESGFFYETPKTYKVPVEKILSFNFSKKGEYELLFSVIDLDIYKSQIISI